MTIKTYIYLVITLVVFIALDGVRLNEIFKKNKYVQARLMYLFITLSISYLVTNFIYDFLKL